MAETDGGPSGRLTRRLGTFDAVALGLGSMIGAGVFAAVGPAADAAGSGLLIGLGVAGAVAYCNATSSAQLAALYPESGGTYVYGRERLGAFWGYLAGWGFVVGKTASCAAMALTFGSYVATAWARPLAAGAVIVFTVVNYRGIEKTAGLTKAVVAIVLASLAVVVAGAVSGGDVELGRVAPSAPGPLGILQAAGLLFFAFAGYARIATLGEEVTDPARTIPRAIPLALGITIAVYALVMGTALAALGSDALASAEAPLAAAAGSTFAPIVRTGAAVAAGGVLLSLLAGVSRTGLAMARRGDLPRALDAVHPRYLVPHRVELAVGGLVLMVVLLADLRGAIGFSSFCVLAYYGIANAAALTLSGTERRRSRAVAAAGVVGCTVLAFTLPATSVMGGLAVFAVGILLRLVRR